MPAHCVVVMVIVMRLAKTLPTLLVCSLTAIPGLHIAQAQAYGHSPKTAAAPRPGAGTPRAAGAWQHTLPASATPTPTAAVPATTSAADLREQARRHPDNAPLQADLAGQMLKLGMNDDAVAALRRAVALEPDVPSHAQTLAAVLLTQGNASAAVNVLTDAAKWAPEDPQLAAALAGTLEVARDFPAAAYMYRTLIRLEPQVPRWTARQAECLYQAADYSAAATAYAAAFRIAPQSLSAGELARCGDAGMRASDVIAADVAYEELSRRSLAPVRQLELLRGLAALRRGDLDRSRRILQKAATLWPDDAQVAAALRQTGAVPSNATPDITPVTFFAAPQQALKGAQPTSSAFHAAVDDDSQTFLMPRQRRSPAAVTHAIWLR